MIPHDKNNLSFFQNFLIMYLPFLLDLIFSKYDENANFGFFLKKQQNWPFEILKKTF